MMSSMVMIVEPRSPRGFGRRGVLSQSRYAALRSNAGPGSIQLPPCDGSNRKFVFLKLRLKWSTKYSATRLANIPNFDLAFSLTALVWLVSPVLAM